MLPSNAQSGTSHGTPYDYDTHVPFIILGARVKAKHIVTPVHVTDLAPTLASLLGINWTCDERESVSRAELFRK